MAKWFIQASKNSPLRFRLPLWAPKLGHFVPQPRWLRRWYYRKSYQWWGHPSNHHWKGSELERYKELRSGERDLWSGSYCAEPESRENVWFNFSNV